MALGHLQAQLGWLGRSGLLPPFCSWLLVSLYSYFLLELLCHKHRREQEGEQEKSLCGSDCCSGEYYGPICLPLHVVAPWCQCGQRAWFHTGLNHSQQWVCACAPRLWNVLRHMHTIHSHQTIFGNREHLQLSSHFAGACNSSSCTDTRSCMSLLQKQEHQVTASLQSHVWAQKGTKTVQTLAPSIITCLISSKTCTLVSH